MTLLTTRVKARVGGRANALGLKLGLVLMLWMLWMKC